MLHENAHNEVLPSLFYLSHTVSTNVRFVECIPYETVRTNPLEKEVPPPLKCVAVLPPNFDQNPKGFDPNQKKGV
jgi:hypothetical protein